MGILDRFTEKRIFSKLKEEHKEVKSLLKMGEVCDKGERKEILSKVESLLIPHARGEEKTLYAKLLNTSNKEGNEDTRQLTNEAYEEHRVAEELLKELKSMNAQNQRWSALFAVLKENIEHHIQEEEEELFAKAQSALSDDELDKIYDVYCDVKEKFMKTMPSQGQISERRPHQNL